MADPTLKELQDWKAKTSLLLQTNRIELMPLVDAVRVLCKVVVKLAERIEKIEIGAEGNKAAIAAIKSVKGD